MSKGSEQPAWRWTEARHCEDCGSETLLKNIGRFRYSPDGHDFIRCVGCVNARVQAFIAQTRKGLGL